MYYNNLKKQKKLKFGLIGLVIILIIFSIFSIKYNRKTTYVENIVKDSISYVINLVSYPFKYVSERWDVFVNADNILDEYKELKEYYNSNSVNDIKLEELQNENEKLRELLSISDSILDYEEINATVIHRNANYWLDTLIIDKGKKAGVTSDMAVIVNNGLVGYISSVSDYTSTVTLLTNPNMINKISVRINVANGKYAYGLLSSYDRNSNLYLIEGLSEYYEIPINASVTTTGLTEKFPGGIPIGTVKSINTDNYDLIKIVMAEPIVEVNDITYVTILKRKAISE